MVEKVARTIEILRQVKLLATEYHDLRGRPLGVTGEVAEYEAVSPVRQPGFGALPSHDCLSGRRRWVTAK